MGLLLYLVFLCAMWSLSVFFLEYSMIQIFYISLIVVTMVIILFFILYIQVKIDILVRELIIEKQNGVAHGHIIVCIQNKSHVLAANRVKIVIKLKNSFTGEQGKKHYICTCDNHETVQKDFIFDVKTCGELVVEIKTVRIYDMLGIFSLRKKHGQQFKYIILPAKNDIWQNEEHLALHAVNEEQSSYQPGYDFGDIFAIREYKDGDRIQNIHWKLSSKQKTIMVKEFTKQVSSSIDLYVDFCWNYPQKDKVLYWEIMMQGIYSLALYMLEHRIPVHFCLYNEINKALQYIEAEDMDELYQAMCLIFASQLGKQDTNLWEELLKDENDCAEGIYITTRDADELPESLCEDERIALICLAKEVGAK